LVPPDQEAHDPFRGLRVEGASRFVGSDYGRFVHERAGAGYALLAAAHLDGMFPGLIREPHHLDGVLRPLAGLLQFLPDDQQRKLDVLDRGEDRDQVVGLEDEAHLLGPKAVRLVSDIPIMEDSPSERSSRPERTLNNVVFPDPEEPIMATISPRLTQRSTP
jgi:hypothetical protein